jgi:hypothetical protein
MEEKHHTCYLPKNILLSVTIDDNEDVNDEKFDVFVALTHSITGERIYIIAQSASINQSNWNSTHNVFLNG